jgi:hypothetical protein
VNIERVLCKGPLRPVIGLARRALAVEQKTEAGRFNARGLAAGLVLVVIVGRTNIIAPVVRIWSPKYSTGFPLATVVVVYLGYIIICTALLLLAGSGDD